MMMGQGSGNYGGYGMGGGSMMMLLGILAIGVLFYLILKIGRASCRERV